MKFEDHFRETPVEIGSGKKKKIGGYMIGKTIGDGSFARVKLGCHILSKQKVAIKIISKNSVNQRDLVQKSVRREAAILKKLKHPNIAQLLEVVETENALYIINELAEKGDLKRYVSRRGKLSEEEARGFFRQIVTAVDYMHNAGVIHRDLKIGNLLINDSNDIKITDFGLSGDWDGHSLLNTQCGSPAFAAPEIFEKSRYGPSVDVWTLGVDLYVMVVGKLPFNVEKPTNLSKLHSAILRGFTCPDYLSTACRDLLHRMVEPSTSKRISIREVMVHPWLNVGYATLRAWPSKTGVSADDIDMSVLRFMVGALSVSENAIKDAIINGKINSLTATYKLLCKRQLEGFSLPQRTFIVSDTRAEEARLPNRPTEEVRRQPNISKETETVINETNKPSNSADERTRENGDDIEDSVGIRVEIRKMSSSTDKDSGIGNEDDVKSNLSITDSFSADVQPESAVNKSNSSRSTETMFQYKEMLQKLRAQRVESTTDAQKRLASIDSQNRREIVTPVSYYGHASYTKHAKTVKFEDQNVIIPPESTRRTSSSKTGEKHSDKIQSEELEVGSNDGMSNLVPAPRCIFCVTSNKHVNPTKLHDRFVTPPAPPNSALGGRRQLTPSRIDTPVSINDLNPKLFAKKNTGVISRSPVCVLDPSHQLPKDADEFYDGYRFKVRTAEGERMLSWELKPLRLPAGTSGFHGQSRSKSARNWSVFDEKSQENTRDRLDSGRLRKLTKSQYLDDPRHKPKDVSELSRLGLTVTLPDHNANLYGTRPRKQSPTLMSLRGSTLPNAKKTVL